MDDNAKGGFPSLTALLGLLAVAGYQNRDKIGEWLRGATQQPGGTDAVPGGPAGSPQLGQPEGGLLGGLGGMLGGGLGELVDRFTQSGQGDKADSWVRQGPNQDVAPPDIERALGPEIIAAITRQTGLSREELLERLSTVVPQAVDSSTPDGTIRRAGF
ncbi:hypothetical protein ASE63_14550 [Bosea sp. Root381]|uniref:YidB family protein n=1 Tax=Bosea sp. Root381 TaxID=1736524 RepID=UPI0006F8E70D|nr:YidB family protein [Bosea sp. Root381]KRE17012.1 hypothetical protein ASE63_14550 [Bosea sp. Root381]